MLWSLTEAYVGEHNIDQEKAIVELLSRVCRWRHFIETLEHMSKTGQKVNPLDSLNRINSFLVDKQQLDFNNFLDRLALNGQVSKLPTQFAWNVEDSTRLRVDKDWLLASAGRQDNRRHA